MTIDQASTQRMRYTRSSKPNQLMSVSMSSVRSFATSPLMCTVHGRGLMRKPSAAGSDLDRPSS